MLHYIENNQIWSSKLSFGLGNLRETKYLMISATQDAPFQLWYDVVCGKWKKI